MAQLVEQLIRNQQVAGSSPATSSIKNPKAKAFGFFIFFIFPLDKRFKIRYNLIVKIFKFLTKLINKEIKKWTRSF